jgi:hypothetical protein
MAQAVSRRPLTAEARVRAQVSARGICSGQSGAGTGFSPSSSVFPCQYHSTVARHTHVSSGGWTIGQLVAAVQGHGLTPSIWTTTTRVGDSTSFLGRKHHIFFLLNVKSGSEANQLSSPVDTCVSFGGDKAAMCSVHLCGLILGTGETSRLFVIYLSEVCDGQSNEDLGKIVCSKLNASGSYLETLLTAYSSCTKIIWDVKLYVCNKCIQIFITDGE